MTRARGRQAGRPVRFEEVSARRPRRACTRAAAAAIIGITVRTYRRWHGREALDGAGPGLARLVDGGARSRPRLHPVDRHAPRRAPVYTRGAGPGQGSPRARSPSPSGDPAGPPSAPFRNGHGAGARISGGAPGPRCLARAHAEGQRIETGRAHPRRTGPTHGSDGPPLVQPRPPVRATVSACGGQMRQNEPDRSWAIYTRHVNVRSTKKKLWN